VSAAPRNSPLAEVYDFGRRSSQLAEDGPLVERVARHQGAALV
jgi:hypothetical protein